jgi:hypothetical protein
MPILGVIASSIAKNTFSPTGSFDAIATYTVPAGGVTSVTFAGLPTNGQYSHLQIRWVGRVTAATTDENLQIQVGNSSIDTGANYSQHVYYGFGATTASGASFGNANTTGVSVGRLTGANSTANIYGAGILDILDYSSSLKNKTFRSVAGADQNSSGVAWVAGGAWYNTSPITTIKFNQLFGSGNIEANSQFTIYGIR